MEQLTALDATFLELEEADLSAHMHIGAVMVFEPGDAPSVDEVAADLIARLDSLPRYRQRLSDQRTGGLSWPSWDEVPGFDVRSHIHRAGLPAPGGREELLEWAGTYFSERLDRARPLWELVILEGLEGGRWAMASKTHHCMVDGVGSVDAGMILFDTEPGRPRSRGRKPDSASPPEAPTGSSPLDVITDGIASLAKLPTGRGGPGSGWSGRASGSPVTRGVAWTS